MFQKCFFSFLCLSTLLVLNLHGDYEDLVGYEDLGGYEDCNYSNYGCEYSPLQVGIRHIDGKGIGYREGYTTLDAFLAPCEPLCDHWVPFLDVRGHIFNNGRPAANAGLGLRYLSSRIWGINAYYDYRRTQRHAYNQVSVGLESLGSWDFRINGYLPVGKTNSSLFGQAVFAGFEGHTLFLARLNEAALKGFNAELGTYANFFFGFPLYFAAGTYYLNGEGKSFWGTEGRLNLNLSRYFSIGANTSYDRHFRWIGQGQISLIIPFGSKCESYLNQCCSSTDWILNHRAICRVERHEIIPVDRNTRTTPAIDPLTGLPYVFWFVNNTSTSSLGTFESPFSTLVMAQTASSPFDVIYAYAGDGTTTGMDAGIILKNYQKLFGAGIAQTLATTNGTIVIPALSTGSPSITGSSPIITLASYNEISGIHLITNNARIGILASGITNTFIHDNTLDGTLNVHDNASGMITFSSSGGQISLINNIFNMTDPVNNQFFAVHILSTLSGADYLFENNQFVSTPESSTAAIEFGTNLHPLGNFNSITISQNQFTGLGSNVNYGHAIAGFGFGGTGRLIINENTFSQVDSNGSSAAATMIQIQHGGNIIATITNNTWENSEDIARPSLNVVTQDVTSKVCLTLKGNTSDVTAVPPYLLDNIAGAFTADVSGNTGNVQDVGTITPGTCP